MTHNGVGSGMSRRGVHLEEEASATACEPLSRGKDSGRLWGTTLARSLTRLPAHMADDASRSDVCPDVAGLPVQAEAKNVRKTGSSRGDGHFFQPLFLKPPGSPGYLPMPLACRTEQWRDPSPVSPRHGSSTLQQQLTDLQLASSSRGRQGYREEETVSTMATWW